MDAPRNPPLKTSHAAAEGGSATEAAGTTPCALCGRAHLPLTRHHLIPRTRHRKPRTRRQHPDADFHHAVVLLCKPCHLTVHATLTEKQLAADYHTLEALRSHPELERFAQWAAKQAPDRRIAVKRSKLR